MIVIAAGAVIGGLDRVFGNRLGLGERFEEGFSLLGPLALGMAGIMCLMPLLAALLQWAAAPLFSALGLDPALLAGLLAIDMGGYPLAMTLAENPVAGRFAGIIVGATFGCTAVFTIPVGMSLMPEEAQDSFARGLLIGLVALPGALLPGGLMCGLGLMGTLRQCVPVLIVAALLLWGLTRHRRRLIRGFGALAKGLRIAGTLGITLGAVRHMTGWMPVSITPLAETMEVVSSIAIVLLGSLPLAELVQRLLKKPFERLGRRTGMNAAGTTALLIGLINVTPALGLFRRMDPRSRIVNGAALVCGASAFSAHLAFTAAVEPALVPALLLSKTTGALLGAALALLFTGRMNAEIRTQSPCTGDSDPKSCQTTAPSAGGNTRPSPLPRSVS